MKSIIHHIVFIIINLAILSSFQSCNVFKKESTVSTETISPFIEYTKATIIKNTVDGCSWMLQLEDGKKLEPKELKKEFKLENLKVWLLYDVYKDYSFCMAGEMIIIKKIALRSDN